MRRDLIAALCILIFIILFAAFGTGIFDDKDTYPDDGYRYDNAAGRCVR